MTDCTAPRHAEPEPAAPHAYLCRPCTAGLRRDLHRLPALYAGLGELLDPRRSGPGTGDGDGLPYHEPASECMSQIRHDLAWWAAEAAVEARTALPAVSTIPALAGWLCGHVQWASFRPWSGLMAGAMAENRGRAVALLDPRTAARFAVPGSCPKCQAPSLQATLYRDPADAGWTAVTCTACGHGWDSWQLRRLSRQILEGAAA